MPDLGAFFFEEREDAAVEGRILIRGVTAFAEEYGDGHAPDALARDAPVGPGGDHVRDALFSPGRVPFDAVFDFVEGALAKGGRLAGGSRHRRIDIDEPLLGGAEDDRVVAAPAMRVLVEDVGAAHERAASGDKFDDGGVSLEDR